MSMYAQSRRGPRPGGYRKRQTKDVYEYDINGNPVKSRMVNKKHKADDKRVEHAQAI